MSAAEYTAEQIVSRGEDLYERSLRALLEPNHRGEFVVVDVDTGEFELDADELAAIRRAKAKRPNGVRFIKRIGYASAHRIGGALRAGGE